MFLRHLMLTLIAAVLIISIKHRIHSFEVKKRYWIQSYSPFQNISLQMITIKFLHWIDALKFLSHDAKLLFTNWLMIASNAYLHKENWGVYKSGSISKF